MSSFLPSSRVSSQLLLFPRPPSHSLCHAVVFRQPSHLFSTGCLSNDFCVCRKRKKKQKAASRQPLNLIGDCDLSTSYFPGCESILLSRGESGLSFSAFTVAVVAGPDLI